MYTDDSSLIGLHRQKCESTIVRFKLHKSIFTLVNFSKSTCHLNAAKQFMASSSKHSKLIHIESAHTYLHTITNAHFDRTQSKNQNWFCVFWANHSQRNLWSQTNYNRTIIGETKVCMSSDIRLHGHVDSLCISHFNVLCLDANAVEVDMVGFSVRLMTMVWKSFYRQLQQQSNQNGIWIIVFTNE